MKQRQQMNLISTSHWHLFKERTIELYIPPFAERRHLADLTRFTLPELWPADWTITQPLWWKWWEWPLALEVSIVSLLVIASRKKTNTCWCIHGLALSDLYAFTQKHAHVWYHLQLTGITYPAAADQLQKQKRLESSAWTNTLLLSLSINGSWTVFKKSFLVSPTTQSLLQHTPAFTHIRSA